VRGEAADPILQVLGQGGLLARTIGAYEERPQQLAMARSVLQALEEDRYLLVEAGTGTGKTLAYLLPAILAGRRVVISTATKTLQEQIFFKDVPLLASALGVEIRAAYMKGRSNYLCKQRFEEFAKEPKFAAKEEARLWPEIEAWAASTESGDRAELALPEVFSAWRDLSSTAETCTGQRCPHYEDCFVTQMRRKAQEAEVIVVNHHLFFADLALRTRGGDEETGVEVIPRYDAAIFDEAHALEEIATDYFGVQVSTWRLEELVRDGMRAAGKVPSLAPLVAPLLGAVEGRAAGFFSAVEAATGLLRGTGRGREARDATVRLAAGALAGCTQELSELLHALRELAEGASGAADAPDLEAIARRALTLADELSFVVDVADDGPFVHFVERRGRGLFLRAAPIEIADELARRLYGRLGAAVFTSATLAVGGRFDYVRRRLGLVSAEGEPRVELAELQVGSPFDYRTQAALYLPRHLPEPSDPDFVDAATVELEKLFAVTGGRAFALFTSVRNMQRAWEILEPRLPYRVLLQGQLPKAQLLEKFQEVPSVLFATASFWEGVDVPGEALSLVVMDKLPFASPGDPVVAARIDALRNAGHDPFGAFQVPHAAITLRQGFGRLIRTRTDRGIVAMLDRRIVTRGYGRQFLRSLPDCPKFGAIEHVARWWEAGA